MQFRDANGGPRDIGVKDRDIRGGVRGGQFSRDTEFWNV